MNRFNRFAALRWMFNVIVPPRYRDKLNITEELSAFEKALNKVIEVTNANGRALEAISRDLEDIQFGAGGYYRPAITENEDGSVTFSFAASDDSMPPIEEKTFFLGDMQTITEMLEGFTGEPMAVKNYIDEMSGGYYTPVFEQNDSTVQVSFLASNKMLPALDGYSFTLPSGSTGKSAYDSYLDNGGTLTEKDWVNSLKGEDGESFYQMCVKNGFKGSETDLVIAMKGDPYTLTEADKTEIANKVIEHFGGSPVQCVVTDDAKIILTGVSVGTYTAYFKMEGGEEVMAGVLTHSAETPIETYTVTFMADGVVVATVTYDEGATAITEPTVPAKDGYTGAWESYSLNNTNITVNAVYTAIEVEPAKPKNFAIPNKKNKTDWSIWCNDARFGSDGGYRALTGNVVTNYIDMEVGDIIRFTGLNVSTTDDSMNQGMAFYDGDQKKVSATCLLWYMNKGYLNVTVKDGVYEVDTANLVNHTTAGASEYFRISGRLTGTVDDVVINVKHNGAWL